MTMFTASPRKANMSAVFFSASDDLPAAAAANKNFFVLGRPEQFAINSRHCNFGKVTIFSSKLSALPYHISGSRLSSLLFLHFPGCSRIFLIIILCLVVLCFSCFSLSYGLCFP